ncbi:type II secretion system protein [Marinibacterium profundimaris]|uniref:type II secretion system protein n=1 Tax=Marinibacterium profundimaris TaxID=1679460 RepID=UPI000B5212F1|nr:prepilin-type N-terminal cleavage/methylation domain-containing protein [Marinibacterium profundimaris]
MRNGFTLVELSIVLVILGLLTGGILAGQNLIRAAELRAVTSEFTSYQTAIMAFKEKYLALPGDLKNATNFWGAADSDPATCRTTASTGTEPCNGDGNGQVLAAGTTGNEMFRFWQHLANAGLVSGSFNGIAGSLDVDDAEIDINSPSSKSGNGGWQTSYIGGVSGSTIYYDGSYGHIMGVGADTDASLLGLLAGPTFKPEEAWSIDSKVDDGKPATGQVFNWLSTNTATPGCTTTDDADTAEYALTSSDILCAIAFRNAY